MHQEGGRATKKQVSDFNLLQCNPTTLKVTQNTCLPMEMLIRLRDAWNEEFPKHAIPHHYRTKSDLWAQLRTRMRNQYKCSSEYCALQELGDPVEKATGAVFFRPPKPDDWIKNPTDWHDSNTIASVMEQYEDAFPSFEFIGPVPIDFDARMPGIWGRCVVDELCTLDLQIMAKKGKKSIGVVFNLDPHDKPGSHWVCAYVDMRDKKAYFYDSYGYEPCAEIRRFLRRCKEQGCEEIIWNDIPHQKKNSECGTYCMYVIISLLKGKSFADICKDRVDDDTMNAFRDLLFATARPGKLAMERVVKLLAL